MNESAIPAIVLLAHGARDPRWGEPFVRIADRVRAAAPGLEVELAYLEHLSPSLEEAVRRLVDRGARSIRVVPLFFGRGGHLREDVPRRVATIAAGPPGVSIDVTLPAGDDDVVQDAPGDVLHPRGAGRLAGQQVGKGERHDARRLVEIVELELLVGTVAVRLE